VETLTLLWGDLNERTGLKYDMVYCWVIRFGKERKINKVRAYLNTDLLTRAVEENR
jgi:ketosteroid isomerase-like protein